MSSSSSLLVLFSLLSLFLNVSLAENDRYNHTAIVITNSDTPPPLPPPSPLPQHNFTSSLMPGIAVVIAVLTAVFSLTFLLLLYVKHCKRRNGNLYVNHPQRFAISGYGGGYYGGGGGGRKNSGIDRSVIESLPVFRFGALRGQKEGLECAVCLARFEPMEVLRLLPKCKHAFHVECVDTWLDAHSTCPLCRYRVDPEDILLIGDCNSWFELRFQEESNSNHPGSIRFDRVSRISGRHSSAGERASRLHGIRTSSSSKLNPMSFRRSLDSSLKINDGGEVKSESVAVNCLDRLQRKDGLLLNPNRESFEGRFDHRIIISGGNRDQRWSEVRPSDLLYLRSEMILSDCRKIAAAEDRRDVINGRSVSELTSIERRRRWAAEPRQRQATAVISRWLAWSHRASASSNV